MGFEFSLRLDYRAKCFGTTSYLGKKILIPYTPFLRREELVSMHYALSVLLQADYLNWLPLSAFSSNILIFTFGM
jgi:hypothetical protein